MSTKKKFLALCAAPALGVTLLLSGCGGSEIPAEPVTTVGDRAVMVYDKGVHIFKLCDGTTLLYVVDGYQRSGLSAIPNSPECAE